MVSLVNSHTNATSKRWHLWEIDSRFALNSTRGRVVNIIFQQEGGAELDNFIVSNLLVEVPSISYERGTLGTLQGYPAHKNLPPPAPPPSNLLVEVPRERTFIGLIPSDRKLRARNEGTTGPRVVVSANLLSD